MRIIFHSIIHLPILWMLKWWRARFKIIYSLWPPSHLFSSFSIFCKSCSPIFLLFYPSFFDFKLEFSILSWLWCVCFMILVMCLKWYHLSCSIWNIDRMCKGVTCEECVSIILSLIFFHFMFSRFWNISFWCECWMWTYIEG